MTSPAARLAYIRIWHAHRTLPHGERPTIDHLRVFKRLIHHPDDTPSHRTLAIGAKVCIRTVHNALHRAAELGLLTWTRRGITLSDGRVWQLPNRYVFLNSLFFLFRRPAPKPEREKEILLIDPKTWVGKLSPEALQTLRVKWGLA